MPDSHIASVLSPPILCFLLPQEKQVELIYVLEEGRSIPSQQQIPMGTLVFFQQYIFYAIYAFGAIG